MRSRDDFEIFLATAPGLEQALWAEAREASFKSAQYVPGGVTMTGTWPDVWRANLELRGASRITARLAAFTVTELSDLERRAARIRWGNWLRADVPFRVEATCRQSRIYHSGAAAERVETAICNRLGTKVARDAEVCVTVRLDDNRCTIGIDTSGELLHKRGFKEAIGKAPLRETLAALFLRQCGYDGREPVVDPMCGSGTFVIEAAEMAAGLKPGRSRRFAFEQLATFDEKVWKEMRAEAPVAPVAAPLVRVFGSDRDAGAIRMSRANAERAGVSHMAAFQDCDVRELSRPEGEPGLVIVNPPYGERISDKARLGGLYRALGDTLRQRFAGWRVGLITSEPSLAAATKLPFSPPGPPIPHGPLRIKLYQTAALP